MFSALFSLVSLSLLSSAAVAAPIESRQIDTNVYCGSRFGPGGLCLLNNQPYDNSTTLTDSFSFDVVGKTGLSNGMDFLSLDFQKASNNGQEELGDREFHPVSYNISDDKNDSKDFHYDDVKIPCGLAGRYFLNIVGHSSAGVNHTVSVENQRFGPFNVKSQDC